MSVLAVGPALDIDGPLPVAPEYSLLSVPGVLVEGGGDRWMNGVIVEGYPEETPESWEPCSAGTFRVKAEGDSPRSPRFDPFGLYVPITCSSLSFGGNWEDFARRASSCSKQRSHGASRGRYLKASWVSRTHSSPTQHGPARGRGSYAGLGTRLARGGDRGHGDGKG